MFARSQYMLHHAGSQRLEFPSLRTIGLRSAMAVTFPPAAECNWRPEHVT